MSAPTLARPMLVHTRSDLQDHLADVRAAGGRVGLVPTMGALHDGHASLMSVARDHVGSAGAVVVSVFVNPLQFGAGEDLERYPRTLAADVERCAAHRVDVVFAPEADEVYPGGEPQVSVEPGPLATVLEGASRPGHFRGVLTVVAKLFGLTRPDVAVFGQKDYQQLTLIRRMVADLCLDVEIVGAETVRESDGLALSSRNRYLDDDQRRLAVALSASLRAAQTAAPDGVRAAHAAAAAVLAAVPEIGVDYLHVAESDLAEVDPARTDVREGRILVTGRLGATRLLDNLPLEIHPTPGSTTSEENL